MTISSTNYGHEDVEFIVNYDYPTRRPDRHIQVDYKTQFWRHYFFSLSIREVVYAKGCFEFLLGKEGNMLAIFSFNIT